MDLTEAKDIKRWQDYTEELYKKGLNDPDNHGGEITHLEPDILECEVKEIITMNKASGVDGIPSDLFQIPKDAVKVLHSVQSLSHVQLFVTLWTATHQASLSITRCRRLLRLMSIESVMPSNYLILCHPLLLPPSIIPSIRVFSNESVLCIRWPKYWSFSFTISPSNEYSGLISFRIDWLGLLAVQGTQLSHPYMTTGKTIAFTRQIFVGKVISLLFNMLRLVITLLPRWWFSC